VVVFNRNDWSPSTETAGRHRPEPVVVFNRNDWSPSTETAGRHQPVCAIFHRDFNNRRQLASYVGFAPSPFQSGNVAHDQGISKAGNRKGRTTGIELAWLWLRYQPDSDLSVWFRTRVGTTKGRIRRIAIVALARKLLVALWRYLETGVVPQGAVLKG
jgi:hypothetical protein